MSRATQLYRILVRSRLDEIPFIVFVSFFITFVLARAYVYITNHDVLAPPFLSNRVYIFGQHVHHLSFGIFILSVVGFLALYDLKPVIHRRLAVWYGIGLGLTFDEFALWLRLEDDYYARITYEVVVSITLLLLSIIYFPSFWHKTGKAFYLVSQKSIGRIYRQLRQRFGSSSAPHKSN